MNVSPPTEPGLRSSLSGRSPGFDHGDNRLPNEDHALEKGSSSPLDSALVVDDVPGFRGLVRLLQCELCNKILNEPLALPCGETLCRSCLPPTHQRQNISYPNDPGRREGFVCPFSKCGGREHPIADCNLDVTLANLLIVVEAVLSAAPELAAPQKLAQEFTQDLETSSEKVSTISAGNGLLEIYRKAEQGMLPFHGKDFGNSQLQQTSTDTKDKQLFTTLVAKVRPDFDCQVCYCLYHSPTTTSCGHTFCKSCLERIRDHSNLCPFCRRALSPYRSHGTLNENKRLKELVSTFCPEAAAARELQIAEELSDGEHVVPIFACALTFPHMPMFLHIFEPRYRLMLRRAIDDGTRCFGMVSHRRGPAPTPDGNFDAPFTQYGTMLYVTSLQMFPDGRSLIETTGIYRFKILSYRWHDGYPLAQIERVEDIPFADEEAMEAAERMITSPPGVSIPAWTSLSTQELHQQGLNFVNSMRNHSEGWFTDKILGTYGQPPQDPAIFPFWMATLLPIHDREKYLVLASTSVRERLKLVVGFIKALEQRSW
ncbi:hypothetical protein ABW19_dt0201440 [Dactylella cylindrospora]|nr:hypothetical protein ABW19_dt0201440 [Dactylella cylindrospora]